MQARRLRHKHAACVCWCAVVGFAHPSALLTPQPRPALHAWPAKTTSRKPGQGPSTTPACAAMSRVRHPARSPQTGRTCAATKATMSMPGPAAAAAPPGPRSADSATADGPAAPSAAAAGALCSWCCCCCCWCVVMWQRCGTTSSSWSRTCGTPSSTHCTCGRVEQHGQKGQGRRERPAGGL